MKLLILFFWLSTGVAVASPLEQARILFFQFEANKQAPKQMLLMLKDIIDPSPVMEAYRGVAIASGAPAERNPISKYRRFSEGRNLIEKSVKVLPGNAEIRMIRLSVQVSTPAFVAYASNIEEDKKIVINHLRKHIDNIDETQFHSNVLIFLLNKVKLTPDEKNLVNEMINKIKKHDTIL